MQPAQACCGGGWRIYPVLILTLGLFTVKTSSCPAQVVNTPASISLRCRLPPTQTQEPRKHHSGKPIYKDIWRGKKFWWPLRHFQVHPTHPHGRGWGGGGVHFPAGLALGTFLSPRFLVPSFLYHLLVGEGPISG